jgi:HAD superfamily hydrolase (TIGR01509 family)
VKSLLGTGLALIFDMDGVIVDSNPVHTAAWKAYLMRLGLVLDSAEERMMGKRNDEIVRDFFGDQTSDAEIVRHGAAKEALYRQMMVPQLSGRLVPGLVPLLDRCRGTRVGLATNAEPLNVQFVLENAGLRDRFEAIIDGHQVEKPKPHPEIYERTAQFLETNPANCIVFEDSFAGAQAARLAGARVVGVSTTHRVFPDVQFTIRDFRDPQLAVWLCQQSLEK